MWILAPWSYNSKDFRKFKNKKVVCSIYHIENIAKNSPEINGSSTTQVYMAFAEHPFVSSEGVPCTAR